MRRRPTERLDAIEQRGAERTCQVMAAHAPVEAGAAKRAARGALLERDPQLGEESASRGRETQHAIDAPQEAPPLEAFEREHAEVAREVVVAHARLAQRRLARARAQANGARAVRNAHQVLEELRHVAIGEAEIAMPSLALHHEQLRIRELRQVRARGRLADLRHLRQLRRGERLAAQERGEHLGARRLADQRRDARDVRSVPHSHHLSAEPDGMVRQRTNHPGALLGEDGGIERRRHAHHLLHPLPDRSLPARGVPRVRASAGSRSSRAAGETCSATSCRTKAPTTSRGG